MSKKILSDLELVSGARIRGLLAPVSYDEPARLSELTIGNNNLLGNNTGGSAKAVGLTATQGRTVLGLGVADSPTFTGLTLTAGAMIQGLTFGLGAGAVATNVALGVSALAADTTGGSNIAIGYTALALNTTASGNLAIGSFSLSTNTTGFSNVAVGGSSLKFNTTGNFNTAVGVSALSNNTTGGANLAFGLNALTANTTGSQNVAVGNNALSSLNITDASNSWNTALGYNTGIGIVTGSGNTILGANVTGLASALTNNIILANGLGVIKARHDGTNWTLTGALTVTGTINGLTIADPASFSGLSLKSDTASMTFIDAAGSVYTGAFNAVPSTSFGAYAIGAAYLWLGTGSTERMRIDTSGNVGIGMTPTMKLDVTGTFRASGAVTLSNLSANGSVETTGGTGALSVVANTGTGNNVHGTGPTIAGGTHTALTALGIRSTGAAFDLTLASSEVLTAGRTLSLNVGDAARTLTLSGNPTIADWFNQSVKTTAAVAFVSLNVGAGTGTYTGIIKGGNTILSLQSSSVSPILQFVPSSGDTWRVTSGISVAGDFGLSNETRSINPLLITGGTTTPVITLGGATAYMTLDSSGNVGIGGVPGAKLEIAQASAGANIEAIRLRNTGTTASTGCSIDFHPGTTSALRARIGLATDAGGLGTIGLYTGVGATLGLFQDSSGNVGIGGSPATKLHAFGTIQSSVAAGGVGLIFDASTGTANTGMIVRWERGAALKWDLGTGISVGGDIFELYDRTGSLSVFQVAPTTGQVQFAANVGFGGTNSICRTYIVGSTTTSAAYAIYAADSTASPLFAVRNDGNIFISKINSFTSASAANLYTDGSTIFKSTSSARYKKNIVDYARGLTDLLKLRPVSYEGISKVDAGKTFAGLIAEEVEAAGLTEYVTYDPQGRPDALQYSQMVALLINSVKDLTARLVQLESK